MFPVLPGQLIRMQAPQEDAMRDACTLLEPTLGATRNNKTATTYQVAGTSICGLKQAGNGAGVGTSEVLDSTAVVLSTPTLRLPVGTVVGAHWQVRITHRNGQALATPLLYDVVGDPATIGTAIVLELLTTTRRVQ